MKLDDLIALAKAGYKLKEIKALEEAEEKEKAKEETKPEEATAETKPEPQPENETPESGSDELAELKEKIEGFEKEKEDLKKKLEEKGVITQAEFQTFGGVVAIALTSFAILLLLYMLALRQSAVIKPIKNPTPAADTYAILSPPINFVLLIL